MLWLLHLIRYFLLQLQYSDSIHWERNHDYCSDTHCKVTVLHQTPEYVLGWCCLVCVAASRCDLCSPLLSCAWPGVPAASGLGDLVLSLGENPGCINSIMYQLYH